LAAGTCVHVPPGSYKIKNIHISGGRTLLAHGAYFTDMSGALYVFKITDYASKLIGAYISSALNCVNAAVVVDEGMACEISSVRILNTTTAIQVLSASDNCARLQIQDVVVINYSNTGLYIGPNANEINATNLYLDSNYVASKVQPSKGMPKPNTYGIRHSPGSSSTYAIGGHMFTQVTCINMQTGILSDGGQLTKFSNCIVDSCSGVGVKLKNATNIDIEGMFIGTTGRALEIGGTSSNIHIGSLKTLFTNLIPPFGGSDYFTSSGITPGNDLYVTDTAKASINTAAWTGTAKNFSIAPTSTITFMGADSIRINTSSDVAGNMTTYLLNQMATVSEDHGFFTAPFDGYTTEMSFYTTASPGAGETYTYTFRINRVDSNLKVQISGAGVYSSTLIGTRVSFAKGDNLCIKLVTSAGAAAASHRGYLSFIPNT